jgi:hypothetical protein
MLVFMNTTPRSYMDLAVVASIEGAPSTSHQVLLLPWTG